MVQLLWDKAYLSTDQWKLRGLERADYKASWLEEVYDIALE